MNIDHLTFDVWLWCDGRALFPREQNIPKFGYNLTHLLLTFDPNNAREYWCIRRVASNHASLLSWWQDGDGCMGVIASSFHGENSFHRPTNPLLLLSRRSSSSIILRPPPFTCRRERWKARQRRILNRALWWCDCDGCGLCGCCGVGREKNGGASLTPADDAKGCHTSRKRYLLQPPGPRTDKEEGRSEMRFYYPFNYIINIIIIFLALALNMIIDHQLQKCLLWHKSQALNWTWL